MRRTSLRSRTRFPWPAERMESKLFIVFLFLILLPIGVLTYISSQSYSESIEDNTVTYVSQLSDQMMGKLDDYIEDVKKISIIPSYLEEIKDALKMSNHYYEELGINAEKTEEEAGNGGVLSREDRIRLEIDRKVGNSIYFINNIKKGTNTVYLFDRYGHPYSTAKSTSIRVDMATVLPRWTQLAKEAHGTPVLVSTQEVSGTAMSKKYVFSVVREIIDPTTFDSIGMIGVDASIAVIDNIVKDLDQSTHGTTLIVDEEGNVVYDSEKKRIGRNLTDSEWLPQAMQKQGSFHTTIEGKPVLAIYKASPVTEWKVLITVPEQELMANAMRTRTYTIAIAVAIMIVALLTSLFLVFALTQPLRSLVRIMKEVQTGNLDVAFPVKRRDEIGQVGNAFNRMLDRIKTLIQDIYRVEERKKEAELQSLQHQINPHFIYNTLESIQMTAILHDDSEIGNMTLLLGKLLRYSIHAGLDTVPIAKEWEHLRMYVQLLNYRYGSNRFDLQLPSDKATEDIHVLKLLFQPIIENAVYHGLDESGALLNIVITCRREGTDLFFEVQDNGVGMDEATLLRLRSGLDSVPSEESGRGIGLRNVHERIKLRYGEQFGLNVESDKGLGTKVTIRLPDITKQLRGLET